MNFFTLLETPVTAIIDLDKLKLNYQTLAGKNHPDQGGDEETFKQINLGYNTLKITHSRLKHLLAVRGHEFSARGTVSNNVMNFFMPVGELIQSIDSHVKKVETASSVLQKAMLTPVTMELQSQVEVQIDSLDQVQNTIETSLEAHSASLEKISIAARDLTFLTKWKAELRERYAKLFI